MSFITKKHLSRRTILKGVGATLALPLLDSMIPALTAQTKTAAAPLQRLGFVYIPHGAVMDKFTPVATGSDFEFSPVLKPLEPIATTYSCSATCAITRPTRSATAARTMLAPAATFLNGVHPKRTEGEDVRAGTTIDQIAAQKIGQDTRYPVDRNRHRGHDRTGGRLRRRI